MKKKLAMLVAATAMMVSMFGITVSAGELPVYGSGYEYNILQYEKLHDRYAEVFANSWFESKFNRLSYKTLNNIEFANAEYEMAFDNMLAFAGTEYESYYRDLVEQYRYMGQFAVEYYDAYLSGDLR